jgi:hypothetical protein
MPLHLPIQAVVDRRAPLSLAPMIDQEVHEPKTGKVIQILRAPVHGPYGFDPNDPVWFPPHVNPRTAVCQVLSSYAVSRCLRGGGYF